MGRNLKKWIAGLLIAGLAAGLAACGSDAGDASAGNDIDSSEMTEEPAQDSDISVGIVLKTATNTHFREMAYGAIMAGEELGITVKVDNTATEADVDGQVTKCENLITAGIDALILTPNDSSGVANAVIAAHDAGIPFVTMDTEVDNIWGDDADEYLFNFIGDDYEGIAYNLAKAVCEKLGGEGNVVILRGVDAASSSMLRVSGMERAISEYDGITIVESQSANYDQDTAATIMADVAQAHTDIDAVLCCNDLMALGAITALEENGRDVSEDDIIVVGFDGSPTALESIEDGKLYATSYDYGVLQGYIAVMQAYDLIQGQEVPEETLMPDVLITSENLDEHMPRAQELANWNMGSTIDEIPDFMWDYVEEAKALLEE